jgi:hypothetical protein
MTATRQLAFQLVETAKDIGNGKADTPSLMVRPVSRCREGLDCFASLAMTVFDTHRASARPQNKTEAARPPFFIVRV